jgi:hypothetical protein
MARKGISISEACRLLGKSAGEVQAMMDDGRLRHRRVNTRPGKPARIVIHYSDVAALLQPSAPVLPSAARALATSRLQDAVSAINRAAKQSILHLSRIPHYNAGILRPSVGSLDRVFSEGFLRERGRGWSPARKSTRGSASTTTFAFHLRLPEARPL